MTNIAGGLIALLLVAVAFLAVAWWKERRFRKSMELRISSSDDQVVSARAVPDKLRELFRRSYGPGLEVDDEISVCFRFAQWHKISEAEQDNYPVDGKIMLHREAYLADSGIARDLAALMDGLQKAGLEFIALYGKKSAATTKEFGTYLASPGAVQHGTWKPSSDLAGRFSTKLGRDTKGRFASVGVGR